MKYIIAVVCADQNESFNFIVIYYFIIIPVNYKRVVFKI